MHKISKRFKKIREKITFGQFHPILEAFTLLKEFSTVKFVESVDVSINLGVDAKKTEQSVRGSVVLPHGTGRSVKVAVFTQGAAADAAREAGADMVGFEDLAQSVKTGNIDFDVVLATPDAMRIVGQLGQILGPRGLMPNPKVGTVTVDIATAVKNAKAGQIQYKNDKAGIIHAPIGKTSFEVKALQENLEILLSDLRKHKPTSSKGTFLRKITLSTTMGPGLIVDQASLVGV